ncbi:CDP-alcohol phosphatidyltransferase family protein [Haloechinothrix sp. YIM 98757]|uniref:CDP-alcohol phosphatidyltransferase family protein n=1 Tax=Haloechinothrix aidingensis TaxID=2752311 RepID=A0A837ZX83_9PSEU|nr:CDP-alcohol phosphatidyltransferase family protein [Haloechinothrix aidingensis]
MHSLKPSIADLRAACHPDSVLGRASGEHWAGRLYMRNLSLYLTRALLPTPITPNGVTWLMIGSGLLAAGLLGFPYLWAAVLAFVLIQLQLLFDCSDGEIARWRGTSSPAGVYLDRIGHFSTDAALVAALGVRADGGYSSIGGWTTLGLATALLVLMIKSETELVHVARAHAGRALLADDETVMRKRGLRNLRQLVNYVPFHRLLLAIELSMLALIAAVADAVLGSLTGTRILLVALVPIAIIVVIGHLVSVLTSRRLR